MYETGICDLLEGNLERERSPVSNGVWLGALDAASLIFPLSIIRDLMKA